MSAFQMTGLEALKDNYIWVLVDSPSAVVIDPASYEEVAQFLIANQLDLGAILITHRHMDHIGGVKELLNQWPVPVYGPAHSQMPWITHALVNGDSVSLGGNYPVLRVMALPGHTIEHIAYYANGILFCGDVLFACGCGRMFEGGGDELWYAMQMLRALPSDTLVYCAHEYTLANIAFARSVEPDNLALIRRHEIASTLRSAHVATVPFLLSDEIATNPFLRWDQISVRAAVHEFLQIPSSELIADKTVLWTLRQMKNKFA